LTWRCSGISLDETKRADAIYAPLLIDPPAQSLMTTLKTSCHSELVCDGGKAVRGGVKDEIIGGKVYTSQRR
jgi:hypothetical protein